jgi:hypothetical protein
VRTAYAALLRLLWTLASQSVSPHAIPSALLHGRLPGRFTLDPPPGTLEAIRSGLESYLAGESDGFLDMVSAHLPTRPEACLFLVRLWEGDIECLREFYRFGPERSRQLRQQFDIREEVIGQAELDDLLVMMMRPSGSSPGDSSGSL